MSEVRQFGPAMALLTDKQRKYVHALFEAPRTHGAGVFAVKMAGYGTATSSRQSLAQLAYQLNGDPKIQAAVAEVSQQHLTVLGPVAVRAAKRVLGTPSHRDFGRVLGIVMDRVAPANSTHTVKVEGEVKLSAGEAARVMDRIEELCSKFSVALPKPKIIDHEAIA